LTIAALDAGRVTTVPRPEIENTSSTGIRNGRSTGRFRLRDVAVDRFHQA